MADKTANGAKIPISLVLDDKTIDGAVVKPLMFKPFVDFITEANAMKVPASFDARLKRIRMTRQVDYYVNGSTVPVGMEQILKLSIPDAHKIMARLDDDEGKVGKIVRDGDGISQAITYALATPIPVKDKPPITELEFHASTYGEIEDVLAADNDLQKAAKLIEIIGKPLGHPSLMTLPSWAISLITANDGIQISRDVLPRFLGSPED